MTKRNDRGYYDMLFLDFKSSLIKIGRNFKLIENSDFKSYKFYFETNLLILIMLKNYFVKFIYYFPN